MRHFSPLLTISFLTIFGCGGGPDDLPELGEVSGVVTLDGDPLADAKVAFRPIGNTEANPSYGITNEKGEFTLKYGQTKNLGAVLGEHKVYFESASEESSTPVIDETTGQPVPGTGGNTGPTIPKKYNAQHSKLTATVKEGIQKIPFELDSTPDPTLSDIE